MTDFQTSLSTLSKAAAINEVFWDFYETSCHPLDYKYTTWMYDEGAIELALEIE